MHETNITHKRQIEVKNQKEKKRSVDQVKIEETRNSSRIFFFPFSPTWDNQHKKRKKEIKDSER